MPTKVQAYLANKVFVYFLKKKNKNNWHEVGNNGVGGMQSALWSIYEIFTSKQQRNLIFSFFNPQKIS